MKKLLLSIVAMLGVVTMAKADDYEGLQLEMVAYTTGWGGSYVGCYTSEQNEPGSLSLTKNVQELMTAESFSTIGEFGGFLVKLGGLEDYVGYAVEYTITCSTSSPEIKESGTVTVGSTGYELDTWNFITLGQFDTQLVSGNYSFSTNDEITTTVKVLGTAEPDPEYVWDIDNPISTENGWQTIKWKDIDGYDALMFVLTIPTYDEDNGAVVSWGCGGIYTFENGSTQGGLTSIDFTIYEVDADNEFIYTVEKIKSEVGTYESDDYFVVNTWVATAMKIYGGTIDESTGTSIQSIKTDADAIELARYNLMGQKISGEQKGINIIVYSDGSSKKVLVK